MTNGLRTNELGIRWILAVALMAALAAPVVRADDAPAPMTPAEKKAAAIEKAKEAAAAKKEALAEKIAAAKEAAAAKKAALAEKMAAAKEAAAEKKAAAVEKAKAAKEAAIEKAKAAKEAAAEKKAAAIEKAKAAKEAAIEKAKAAKQALADKKAAAEAAKKLAMEEKMHPPGTLTINATAGGEAVQIELLDPQGNKELAIGTYDNKHARPGTWKVAISATGYATQAQEPEVTSKKITDIKVELKKAMGAISVMGSPADANVHVRGPGGFATKGKLPFEVKDLVPGKYELKISKKGYTTDYPTTDVKVGETATVTVDLKTAELKKNVSFPGMVHVAGGKFMMGSEDGGADEKPVTNVTLSSYFIDKNDVTVAEYAECVKAGKCSSAGVTGVNWEGVGADEKKLWAKSCNWGAAGRENHPINCVTWDESKIYCEAQGARLPTEAEWEFAARGSDGRKYPWGNQAPDAKLANACGSECREYGKKVIGVDWKTLYETDDASPTTSPVGSFAAGASPFGALDMAGNVWQWTADAYEPYPGGETSDPKHMSGKLRVDRGGGWRGNAADRLRSSLRDTSAPDTRVSDLGFRCARSEGSTESASAR